jgi:hypothetical protein
MLTRAHALHLAAEQALQACVHAVVEWWQRSRRTVGWCEGLVSCAQHADWVGARGTQCTALAGQEDLQEALGIHHHLCAHRSWLRRAAAGNSGATRERAASVEV